MVKTGGNARVNSESIGEDRILRHASVKMELPHFVKTGSAPECVSRQSSIGWRSSSRLSTPRQAWTCMTMAWRWWSRSSLGGTTARFVRVVVGEIDHTIAWRNGGLSLYRSGESWSSWPIGCDE